VVGVDGARLAFYRSRSFASTFGARSRWQTDAPPLATRLDCSQHNAVVSNHVTIDTFCTRHTSLSTRRVHCERCARAAQSLLKSRARSFDSTRAPHANHRHSLRRHSTTSLTSRRVSFDRRPKMSIVAHHRAPTTCVGYLDQAFSTGYQNFQNVKRDADLEAVRKQAAFKAMLKKYEKSPVKATREVMGQMVQMCDVCADVLASTSIQAEKNTTVKNLCEQCRYEQRNSPIHTHTNLFSIDIDLKFVLLLYCIGCVRVFFVLFCFKILEI
jgi:hypothetical protein